MEPPSANVSDIAKSDPPIAVDRTGLPAIEVRPDSRQWKNNSTKARDHISKDLMPYLHEPDGKTGGDKGINVLSVHLPWSGCGRHRER